MIDANFKSTIYLKNDVEISPVTVTPVLYLSNGKKVTLPDVKIEPSGTATINVNDALNQKGIAPWATLTGYVEIQYNWPWDPLCVTVTSVDTVHSVIFTNGLRPTLPTTPKEKGAMAKGPGTQTLEGMWWKQEPDVTGFVALSNTTEQPMKAQLQVSDAAAKPLGEHAVTVSPHGTKVVILRELQSSVGTTGGLRVTYYGVANQLIINGGLEDQAVGYSASLLFAAIPSSPAKPLLQSYAELGLMSGAADPMMQFPAGTTFTPYSVLRNISDAPAALTPTIYWMAGATARSARLGPLSLSPYQTQSLDVPALLSAAGLPNFNGGFNLVFEVEGSVLMASGSVDQKNTYVFEVLPKAVLESASKNLAYWSTANGDDTMVTLWNPADEAQDFVFTLFFSGGHYDLPIHLEARATSLFNVSEIVQNQIPDKDGNLIPPNMHEGSARISGPHSADNEAILVEMDAGVYNVRKATCHDGCNNCNGVVSILSTPDSFDLSLPSGQAQITFSDQWNTGIKHDLTSAATWSSTKTTVATVSKGLTKAVAVGSAVVDGVVETDPWAGQVCGSPAPACPPDMGVDGSSLVSAGKPVSLFSTNCETQPNADWSASWGYLADLNQCSLTESGPALPPGGSCVTNGTVNGEPRKCYQFNQNNCSYTYCPGSTRVVNSACTQFVDQFPVITIKVCP